MIESASAIVRVSGPAARETVAGLTVLERVVRSALEAGARPCIVLALDRPSERVMRLPGVRWTPEETTARQWAGDEFTLVETDALYDPRLLRWVMASLPEAGRARTIRYEGRPLLSKVHVGEKKREVSISAAERVPESWVAPVRTPVQREFAEDWLFDRLSKPNEGLMSRFLERPLSKSLTRLLCRFPITPNMMTALSFAVGLWSARQLSQGSWMRQVTGAVLLWLHSVLDGCDGELARLKFQETKKGALLDFWTDNAVHGAVFAGIGWGLSRQGHRGPFVVGLSAAVLALSSAAVLGQLVARREGVEALGGGLRPDRETDPAKRQLLTALDVASRRDFIYLALAAALFDKLSWFNWAAAAGGALYLAGLLWARRRMP